MNPKLNYLHQSLLEASEIIETFPFEDKAVYADFLAQTYYFVRHSTRLLALAASKFDENNETLFQRFLEHAGEEKAHQRLAARDLKALGYQLEQLAEHPQTKFFYRNQYLQAANVGPAALFGYIVFLEGIAVLGGKSILKKCVAAHGADTVSFIKLHANEDPDHLEKALSHLEALSPNDFNCARDSFFESLEGYLSILRKVAPNWTPAEAKGALKRAA